MTHSFPTRRSSDLLCRSQKGKSINNSRHPMLLNAVQAMVFDFRASRDSNIDREIQEKESCKRFNHDSMQRLQRGQREDLLALRSEEHTSELQSLMCISNAVFCLKKKKHKKE